MAVVFCSLCQLKSISCSFCTCQRDYYSWSIITLGKTKPWNLITVDCQKCLHRSITAVKNKYNHRVFLSCQLNGISTDSAPQLKMKRGYQTFLKIYNRSCMLLSYQPAAKCVPGWPRCTWVLGDGTSWCLTLRRVLLPDVTLQLRKGSANLTVKGQETQTVRMMAHIENCGDFF